MRYVLGGVFCVALVYFCVCFFSWFDLVIIINLAGR